MTSRTTGATLADASPSLSLEVGGALIYGLPECSDRPVQLRVAPNHFQSPSGAHMFIDGGDWGLSMILRGPDLHAFHAVLGQIIAKT